MVSHVELMMDLIRLIGSREQTLASSSVKIYNGEGRGAEGQCALYVDTDVVDLSIRRRLGDGQRACCEEY